MVFWWSSAHFHAPTYLCPGVVCLSVCVCMCVCVCHVSFSFFVRQSVWGVVCVVSCFCHVVGFMLARSLVFSFLSPLPVSPPFLLETPFHPLSTSRSLSFALRFSHTHTTHFVISSLPTRSLLSPFSLRSLSPFTLHSFSPGPFPSAPPAFASNRRRPRPARERGRVMEGVPHKGVTGFRIYFSLRNFTRS